MCYPLFNRPPVGRVRRTFVRGMYGITLIVFRRLLQRPLDTAGYNLGSPRRIIHYLHEYEEFSL